jgi:hypothetical protein
MTTVWLCSAVHHPQEDRDTCQTEESSVFTMLGNARRQLSNRRTAKECVAYRDSCHCRATGYIAVCFLSLQAHAKELPEGVDRTKYIASGLVAFDLRTRIVKWTTHLDLSTDSTTYRAYAYSAPTLVDIDRDGKLEVIAGTSVVRLRLCCAQRRE